MGAIEGLGAIRRLAPLVRESGRFAVRFATRSGALGRYRLRESGVVIHLRHGTPDINTFEEVFDQRQYELPEPVMHRLEGLTRPPRVLDLGANVGLFSAYLLGRLPAAEITCFEPDRANAAVLSMSIQANGEASRWTLVEACASNHGGETPFAGGRFALSRIEAPSADLPMLPAVDVLPALAGADLVKIDIEGGEWAILGDPRFASAPARAVVIEYHPHLCPEPDAHGAAVRALEGAGLRIGPGFHDPAGHGRLWAWTAG